MLIAIDLSPSPLCFSSIQSHSFTKSFKLNHVFFPIKQTPRLRFVSQPPKCSISVVVEPPQIESAANERPFPAEISRTITELASKATLSTLTKEGWPLGIGVRFTVDLDGTPLFCFNDSITDFPAETRSGLHVQLEQCGLRTPQCSILGKLAKPTDKMASKKLLTLWKQKFGTDVDEDLLYTISVDRILYMEDFGEDGVWVTPTHYKSVNPDPLREFAESLVNEINNHNSEDLYRFCNIYADLGFQVLDAKMVWVDRLGFDVRVRSTTNDEFEVRIPFPREVSDEKGAKSSFNGMSQLAWEVEKNIQIPDFEKVKYLKKITSR